MVRRIRIHGNFAEYVPFLLFILFLIETHGGAMWLVGCYAAAIIVGRLLHFYGLYSPHTPSRARVIGMQLTLWPLVLGSGYLVYLGLG